MDKSTIHAINARLLFSPLKRGGRGCVTVILKYILVILLLSATAALSAGPQEYDVKAAFLYNFAKFAEWPEKSFNQTPTNICIGVLGDNPFGKALEAFKGKATGGKSVVIRQYSNAEEAKNCHIVFISESESGNIKEILRSLKDSHVLTVSDMEGFSRSGGMITLVIIDDSIGFDINLAAAHSAGLEISSQLLKLARKVIQ